MIAQTREAERVRSQMVILERRVQILHEEKAVLTSMERRLQERCAELQREIFRLQGAHNETNSNFKSLDKQPITLPRHIPPPSAHKQDSSEHEDEGISSSDTGPSISPVPILVLPQEQQQQQKQQHILVNNSNNNHQAKHNNHDHSTSVSTDTDPNQEMENGIDNGLNETGNEKEKHHKHNHYHQHNQRNHHHTSAITIESAMEELDNVVKEAEKQISGFNDDLKSNLSIKSMVTTMKEKEIVPVNIVPQPPRKSRSLAHLMAEADDSDLDGSDYELLIFQQKQQQQQQFNGEENLERVAALKTFFDETDYDLQTGLNSRTEMPESSTMMMTLNSGSLEPSSYPHTNTRELLDVIMNARHVDNDPTIKALRDHSRKHQKDIKDQKDLREYDETKIDHKVNNQQRVEDDRTPIPKHRSSLMRTSGLNSKMTTTTTPLSQQFNGVFFMTDMNSPTKYPKPDVTAALQARRVTKNLERLEAVFASQNEQFRQDSSNSSHGRGQAHHSTALTKGREKSQSNQQIYFGNNLNLRSNNENNNNLINSNNQNIINNNNNNNESNESKENNKNNDKSNLNHSLVSSNRPDLLHQAILTSRSKSCPQGSKVTDTLSGLY